MRKIVHVKFNPLVWIVLSPCGNATRLTFRTKLPAENMARKLDRKLGAGHAARPFMLKPTEPTGQKRTRRFNPYIWLVIHPNGAPNRMLYRNRQTAEALARKRDEEGRPGNSIAPYRLVPVEDTPDGK